MPVYHGGPGGPQGPMGGAGPGGGYGQVPLSYILYIVLCIVVFIFEHVLEYIYLVTHPPPPHVNKFSHTHSLITIHPWDIFAIYLQTSGPNSGHNHSGGHSLSGPNPVMNNSYMQPVPNNMPGGIGYDMQNVAGGMNMQVPGGYVPVPYGYPVSGGQMMMGGPYYSSPYPPPMAMNNMYPLTTQAAYGMQPIPSLPQPPIPPQQSSSLSGQSTVNNMQPPLNTRTNQNQSDNHNTHNTHHNNNHPVAGGRGGRGSYGRGNHHSHNNSNNSNTATSTTTTNNSQNNNGTSYGQR